MAVRKIDLMHQMFGTADGKCGECDHLIEGRYHGRMLRKCEIYGLTHSEASDWRKSYNKPPEGGRLPDCPLVPLLEGHGDLIDRDAFRADNGLGKDCENCDRNTRNCNYDICLSRMDVCGWIDDAPIIVPAEGGKADG